MPEYVLTGDRVEHKGRYYRNGAVVAFRKGEIAKDNPHWKLKSDIEAEHAKRVEERTKIRASGVTEDDLIVENETLKTENARLKGESKNTPSEVEATLVAKITKLQGELAKAKSENEANDNSDELAEAVKRAEDAEETLKKEKAETKVAKDALKVAVAEVKELSKPKTGAKTPAKGKAKAETPVVPEADADDSDELEAL